MVSRKARYILVKHIITLLSDAHHLQLFHFSTVNTTCHQSEVICFDVEEHVVLAVGRPYLSRHVGITLVVCLTMVNYSSCWATSLLETNAFYIMSIFLGFKAYISNMTSKCYICCSYKVCKI